VIPLNEAREEVLLLEKSAQSMILLQSAIYHMQVIIPQTIQALPAVVLGMCAKPNLRKSGI
jgi:hypothetical protein